MCFTVLEQIQLNYGKPMRRNFLADFLLILFLFLDDDNNIKQVRDDFT